MAARREVALDADRILTFRRTAEERGLPSRASALYSALADAVRVAETSPELLPRDPGRGAGGARLKESWTQRPEEYRAWVLKLEAAGSSPRAVLDAWMEEYNRVGGDLPAMRWPFRRAELEVAI